MEQHQSTRDELVLVGEELRYHMREIMTGVYWDPVLRGLRGVLVGDVAADRTAALRLVAAAAEAREHVRGTHVARQVVEPLVDLRRRESLKHLLGPFEGLGVQLSFPRWRKGEAGRFGSPVPSGIAHGVIEDVINPAPEVRIGNCHDLAADPCRSEPLPLEGCFAP